MAFNIFRAKGAGIKAANEELSNRFRLASSVEQTATTSEGIFLLEENIRFLTKAELVDKVVVFCPATEPGIGVECNVDFLANCGLYFFMLHMPSSLAGASGLLLEFLGTSHDDLPTPACCSESKVMIQIQENFLSVAQGSALAEIVTCLMSSGPAQKKQKGELVSNSKSSGDDNTQGVTDNDGVVHPSQNRKRDADRILSWTALMRVASEELRKLLMGNNYIPEYKEEEIARRLDTERSISLSRSDSDPLKSIAALDSMMNMEAVRDFPKTLKALSLDFNRIKPRELSLYDFHDGPMSEVYPPSTTARCDMTAMTRLSRMFAGLERFLVTMCGAVYEGMFTPFRKRLTTVGFPGRLHSVAFMHDSVMAPLFILSIELRNEQQLDGTLRGPANVRKLIEERYHTLVLPNNDGMYQAREYDYVNTTHKKIDWVIAVPKPTPSAVAHPSMVPQPIPSVSQLKKMLKQTKGSSSSSAGAGIPPSAISTVGNVPSLPVVSSQAPTAKKGICLHNLAQSLGVQGVSCTHAQCYFEHAQLHTISKDGAIKATDKIKSWTLSISKPDLVKRITASTTMLP